MSTEITRTALVTGAGQGIGRAIALRLADDGLDVAVNDVASNAKNVDEVVAEIRAKGRKSVAVLADVSREDDVKAMIQAVVDALGGLDVMIANAGIGSVASILDINVEDWDRIMSINARGVMLCYKHAAHQMIKQGRGGRILGASSLLGKRGGYRLSAYCATKFAVRALTQCAALELAEHKITVNAYAPGTIATPMTLAPDDITGHGTRIDGLKKAMGDPNGPHAEPDVVASLISYLVKPEAYFITGQAISVDGGLNFQ